MKFIYNLYLLIIISRSTWVVQSAADFTLDELTHLSRELNPMECMRLLEAIYLAIPNDKQKRVRRKTQANTWISKHECLDELKSWNHQFPAKTDPKARVVMILHLNALGRPDLANYVRKYRKANYQDNKKSTNQGIFELDTIKNRLNHLRDRSVTRRVQRLVKIPRQVNHYSTVHRSMIPALAESGATSNSGQATPSKRDAEKSRHTSIPKSSLFIIIALCFVVICICGIVLLIFRRLLASSIRPGKRSDLCPGNNVTQEKGLQCIGCTDDQDDFETLSNICSPITEVDVEEGSLNYSLDIQNRKSFSATLLSDERISPNRVSVEKLKLSDEEPSIEDLENLDTDLQSSCRCRPLEAKCCGSKPKKNKKKSKAKSKEETKSKKSYLKAMQEKLLPRQTKQMKKDCTFDMKQFQEKILTILNKECGVCQCCNCTPHWEVDRSKVKEKRSRKEERRGAKHDKKERKERQSKRDKCEKLSITKVLGEDNEVLTYQASTTSKSPNLSGGRWSGREESDAAKRSKIRYVEKSENPASPRMKRTQDINAVLSAASSESDQKSKKFRGKLTKQLNASANTSLSAHHDKPKRFF